MGLEIDRAEYPFPPHYLELPAGRLHYVDVGQGRPIVMVHGTPTWSFLYRHLMRGLSRTHRVVAPDHIGFGLSDKPAAWSYLPRDHARNLKALIEALELEHIVLVVHDFGGPIGLSYALERPDNVERLVLFNTWMWSLAGDRSTRRASRLFGGALGRFVYRYFNFSPRVIMKLAVGRKERLDRRIHRHYTGVFRTPGERQGAWVLARELVGSTDWYESLWNRRGELRAKPALLLWGEKDPAFSLRDLERWRDVFEAARVVTFPEAGHFVPEEEPEAVLASIEDFLATDSGPGSLSR